MKNIYNRSENDVTSMDWGFEWIFGWHKVVYIVLKNKPEKGYL